MATSSYYKFNQFVEDVAHGVHDLSADTIKFVLTNTLPVATNTILANITEIGAGNGYSTGGAAITVSSSGHTSGTYKLVLADTTITASGGTIGPFQYAVIYNDTPVSPADPLIFWLDYGSAITLGDGESLTLDFSAATGAFTIT